MAALELMHAGRDPLAPALVGRVDRHGRTLADNRSSLGGATSGRLTAEAITSGPSRRSGSCRTLREEGPGEPAWARSDRAVRGGCATMATGRLPGGRPRRSKRAALEGGLEASGLLDAWVTPSGGRVEESEPC